MTIRIKNWSEFQHYKERTPPWIKLYRKLLDDPEWFALSGDASKMLANCWLLASESNGELPPLTTIAFRLRLTEKCVRELISQLSHWLENDDSTTLAPRKQDACLETEAETQVETEKDIAPSARVEFSKLFLEFYVSYPKRKSKKDAAKAYAAATRDVPHETIMAGLARVKLGWHDPQFIPYPASWLRAGGWDDEITPGEKNGHRGSRALQDDSLSCSKAADRLIEATKRGEFTIAPRPSLLPAESPNHLRLLPKG